jgi:hypothetical protein
MLPDFARFGHASKWCTALGAVECVRTAQSAKLKRPTAIPENAILPDIIQEYSTTAQCHRTQNLLKRINGLFVLMGGLLIGSGLQQSVVHDSEQRPKEVGLGDSS